MRADLLLGGAGNDRLQGDQGADTLTVDDGADLFVFSGSSADRVMNFSVVQGDRLGIAAGTTWTIANVSGSVW